MNKQIKTVATVVIVGAVIAATAFKLLNNKKEVQEKVYHPDVNTAAMVQVDTVKAGSFDLSSSFTGAFSPNREVVVGTETSGKVIKVNVEEGNPVHAGQLIAQLDAGVLQAQLQAAQATYERASTTLSRYQQAASGVTQLQIDNANTDVLTSKAQIDQLKKQISQHTISAPFSGIITSRNFDLGAIVSPGTQMATLTDISSLKLEINVPERSVSNFKTGQTIDITTDVHPGITFPGKVDMVASKADASYNFLIKILVPNGKSSLKAGMYGTVSLRNTVAGDVLTIPRSALIGSSLKPQVYVVENGVAKLRDIQTGSGNETRVEVTSGLQHGDIVVSGGLVNLQDGSKVSIAK
ncbi:efflux RND transporter periplasmic adaptor subunit [Sphingobacterium sp. LRF_L2]|uniref:efflux RND transporter periplasmic adaptor subunit n=1 Tax=Sphingobacterium sp. LRF_L2 TaxID=3369421 RepID=UPI003F5DCA9D